MDDVIVFLTMVLARPEGGIRPITQSEIIIRKPMVAPKTSLKAIRKTLKEEDGRYKKNKKNYYGHLLFCLDYTFRNYL